ncbi:hypothetical protein [Kineosporia sp. NBRC 101731]|uniref:hypothetical protein n=1 Tax=Kineosporia sp. NBRC 101731 TaxID=3032199 RepID=UPI0024A20A5D|nr:hypothetical protein [Kineosporia sp. NBRC 101731]GLY26649.1 hypothetical protein Kisp02_00140 [Kineosporia sp. NBRC 101731]
MISPRAAHTGRRRALSAMALIPAGLLTLAACGSPSATPVADATAGPAGLTTSRPSSSATSDSSSTSSSSTTTKDDAEPTADGEGCAADGSDIPAGAATAKAGDLDGDGQADQIWLADDGDTRLLGVKTATGAIFDTTFTSASPIAGSAVANRLSDGSAIILLSTGRSAALYAVIDCQIIKTRNKNDQQYTFDLGYTGYGNGVACPAVDDKLYLAGYRADATGSGAYTITRTRIDLSEGGTRADNGTESILGDFAQGSATYRIAHSVGCGDAGTAKEPQG